MDTGINKIICGDTLEELTKIESESVDITITSPPYNLGDDHHTGSKRHNVYYDSRPEEEYQNWQIEVLTELLRITKLNGSLFYNHKNRIKNDLLISPLLWIWKTNWLLKQEIVWWNGSQNFDPIRFYPHTERIYWLVKHPKTRLQNPISLLDIWHIAPVGTQQGHPRQFPEKVVKNILCCFPKAKIILDCFGGMGTVAVVCKELGLQSIYIDNNPDYCKMAEKRIANTMGRLI